MAESVEITIAETIEQPLAEHALDAPDVRPPALLLEEFPHGRPFVGDLNPFKVPETEAAGGEYTNEDVVSLTEEEEGTRVLSARGDEENTSVRFPLTTEEKVPPVDEEDRNSKKESWGSVFNFGIESFKYLYSLGLLIFSVVIVVAAIFSEQTTATAADQDLKVSPILAFVVFWFLIVWLATMEGGQGALVGLQPVDPKLYANSHPRAHRITAVAHKGNNMERFIVGRQFMVVLVVFVINLMASAVPSADVLSLNGALTEIFLHSGLAVILTTITLGQLMAQVNSANCMLDFINNYFMLFSTHMSLAIETSGLLHAVYLVQIFFSWITGEPIESDEPPRTLAENFFFWPRVLVSMTILAFAFAVTLAALFEGKTNMYESVPETVSVVVFFVLMCFVGMMEGMQIAFFAVVNLPEEELKHHPIAYRNYKLTFSGQNLQAFLIGRQICVTICTFIIARITTVNVDTDAGEATIFGVSAGVQGFFNTGLLGAVITTVIASLCWRIVASSFPVAFLSNPLIFVIIHLCLILEKSGVCSAAWILARYHKLLIDYQPDEVHLEGAERHTNKASTRRDKDIEKLVKGLNIVYTLALLALSIFLAVYFLL
jgi:hypothetical protein